jgi:hypothetical protein
VHVELRQSEKNVGIKKGPAEISGEEVKQQDRYDHKEDFAHQAHQNLIVVQLQLLFEVMFAEGALGKLRMGQHCSDS